MNRRAFLAASAASLGLGAVAPLAAPGLARAAAPRIVVAGGDLTEIVFALGAGGDVIGVDTTSTFPEEAASRAQIGYVRRLSAEGVLSLTPSLVLAAHDAGPPAALDQLEAAGVTVARAPRGDQPTDVPKKIAFVGETLGLPARTALLVSRYEQDLADISAKVARLEARPRVLFILSVRDGAPLVAGQNTSADAIIAAAAGVNAAQGFDGFKPMAQEAVLAAQPDVVLMMAQHAERLGGVEALLQRPDIALTPAGAKRRLIAMDGMLLLGFGPRTPTAIAELARQLHPGQAAAVGL